MILDIYDLFCGLSTEKENDQNLNERYFHSKIKWSGLTSLNGYVLFFVNQWPY